MNTPEGGKKVSATLKEKYGDDYWAVLGRMGGLRKVKKGFACNPELARSAGRIGGLKSRRGKSDEV